MKKSYVYEEVVLRLLYLYRILPNGGYGIFLIYLEKVFFVNYHTPKKGYTVKRAF